MMLGHPEAPIAEPLAESGEVERVAERAAGVAALADGREVEDRKRDHEPQMGTIRRPCQRRQAR
jgi:hypothetical protein